MDDRFRIISSNVELINSLEKKSGPGRKFKENFSRIYTIISNRIFRIVTSKFALTIFFGIYRIYMKFAQIPFFTNIAIVVLDLIHFCRNYYLEFLIISGMLFPSFLILLYTFENSVSQFSIMFFPILLFITFSITVVFYYIDQCNKNEKISILEAIQYCSKKIYSLGIILILHISVIFELLFAFLLSVALYININQIDWQNSYDFWVVTIFFSIVVLLVIILTNILFSQSYFSVTINSESPFQAVKNNLKMVNKNLYQLLFLHISVFIVFSYFIFLASSEFFEEGFGFILLLYYLGSMTLNFLYRSALIKKGEVSQLNTSKPSKGYKILFISLLILGIPASFFINMVLTGTQPQMNSLILEQKENILSMRQMTIYKDSKYGFSIAYPKQWTLYPWSDSTLTMYSNYNGALDGGIWLTITVKSIYLSNFTDLYYRSNPGIIKSEESNKEISTKVTNFTFKGYDAIKYLSVKPTETNAQFQTHYLIHKNDYIYEITFTTNNVNVENDNAKVFERIFDSFTFLDESVK